MSNSYEAVILIAALEMFQEAFLRYMTGLNFDHMSVGGRLGGHGSHEFKRGDDLVSMAVSDEGQSHFRIVVHSHVIDVEQLVLDALTEGMADFLEPFCEALSDQSGEQILSSLIVDLRDAFERVVKGSGGSS